MLMRALILSSMMTLSFVSPLLSQPAQQPQQAAQPAAAPEEPPLPGPLFCTVTSAHACAAQACTKSETMGDLKLPAKILIHFENRMLASTSPEGFPHMSRIASFAGTANDHVLQGVDHAVGWMIHLDAKGSKMTMTMTSNEKVLTGFGTCKGAG